MNIMRNGAELNVDKDKIKGIDIVQEGLTFRIRINSNPTTILSQGQFILSDIFPSRDTARNFVESQGETVDYNINKDTNKAIADTGFHTI